MTSSGCCDDGSDDDDGGGVRTLALAELLDFIGLDNDGDGDDNRRERKAMSTLGRDWGLRLGEDGSVILDWIWDARKGILFLVVGR